jgi:hypothetical protein
MCMVLQHCRRALQPSADMFPYKRLSYQRCQHVFYSENFILQNRFHAPLASPPLTEASSGSRLVDPARSISATLTLDSSLPSDARSHLHSKVHWHEVAGVRLPAYKLVAYTVRGSRPAGASVLAGTRRSCWAVRQASAAECASPQGNRMCSRPEQRRWRLISTAAQHS